MSSSAIPSDFRLNLIALYSETVNCLLLPNACAIPLSQIRETRDLLEFHLDIISDLCTSDEQLLESTISKIEDLLDKIEVLYAEQGWFVKYAWIEYQGRLMVGAVKGAREIALMNSASRKFTGEMLERIVSEDLPLPEGARGVKRPLVMARTIGRKAESKLRNVYDAETGEWRDSKTRSVRAKSDVDVGG
jgi:hypothetical protein